jgi:hypothetical protein
MISRSMEAKGGSTVVQSSRVILWSRVRAENAYWKERISTIVLTTLGHLIFILKIFFYLRYKTSYLNEEVNYTEPFL